MPSEVVIPSEDVVSSAEDAPLQTAAHPEPGPRPLWEIIAELGEQIPAEDRARVPHDGSKNYKHYLYGTAPVE